MALRMLAVVLLGALLTACDSVPEQPDPSGAVQSVAQPAIGQWGVDLTVLDPAIDPGDDFFAYVNGAWLEEHPIPPDRSSFGMMLIVHEQAQERVRDIIEEQAARSGAPGTPEQQVGDYYASWMDTDTLNARGIGPLEADLRRVAAIDDLDALTEEFGRAHFVAGVSPIAQGIGIDPRDPNRYNLNIGLGGMGLPDRDYYLDQSEQFAGIRQAYQAHIASMLDFAGIPDSSTRAADVLALETRIAQYQWPRAERRDRDKTLNPTRLADLERDHPDFDWRRYLAAGEIRDLEQVNLLHPDTLAPLIALIHETPLATWRVYLTYHLISNNADVLSEEIDAANFDFWGRTLSGNESQLSRWKRGAARVGDKSGLGEALGQIYVKRYFPESSKAKMVTLVENLRAAYARRIDQLDWMGPETKREAQAKLAAFRAKIGYPDQWKDLSSIRIDKTDLFGNARRIREFFERDDAERLHRPTDRDEWFLMPQTVNAYYLSNFNEIVFPAAILEPPYFDPAADDAVNYGAIGSIIGHEMGHGFDDQGSKSDARGVQRNWWSEADREAFEQRTAVLADQYDRYEAVPGHFVDGKFTLGENIGDLGGVTVALEAYRLSLRGKPAPVIDGLSGEQRFFLAYGQAWRAKVRDEAQLIYLKSDPHAPARFRLNGVVRNLDAWYEAFNVQPGDALYLPPEERVSIW
jgi:putative endopeptidase